MQHEIKTSTDSVWLIDDSLDLDTIKARIPGFFSESNTTFFGDNRVRAYRGQLIVHSVVELSDHSKHRKINVYLCALDCIKGSDKGRGFDTLHAGWPSDDDEAERLIDYILEVEQCHYGIKPPDDWERPEYCDCGELMDKDCNGNSRCPNCDGPCPCCDDGGGPE